MLIDARGMHYRQLNARLREMAAGGEKEIELLNINGQRYLGSGIHDKIKIVVEGTAGNDLASFLDGPEITVRGNAQDAIGNTMNDGKVVVHGHAGDVLGYGMRGGRIFILGNVGYRVGIHMKAYRKQVPVLIAGGTAGDFCGEYMAGGILIILGLKKNGCALTGDYLGTGMHGGAIYLRGEPEQSHLGREVALQELDAEDEKVLDKYLQEYCQDLGLDFQEVRGARFTKLVPVSHRPYGNLYVS